MYKNISIGDKNISVNLQAKRIGILGDDQLLALVTTMPEAATDELVSCIKKEFCARFDKDFAVSDASMAVEIWGHVFADKFADAIKSKVPVKWLDKLAEKISSHCEVVNIGPKGVDSNRIVWDSLAAFKPVIAAMLLKAG